MDCEVKLGNDTSAAYRAISS